MQITIDTSLSGPEELTALIALCASLGGRVPEEHRVAGKVRELAAGYTQGTKSFVHSIAPTADEDELAATYAETNMGRRGPPLGMDDTPPPPAPTDGAVDSKGIPWDARIHSESKALIADGSWRKRRGVDDAVYAEVMAELQGNDAPPPPPPAEQTPSAPLAPADDAPPPPPPVPAEAPSANVGAAPVAGEFADFPSFVAAVSKFRKTYVELNDLAATVGVAAFKDMKDHPDKWDTFFAMVG